MHILFINRSGKGPDTTAESTMEPTQSSRLLEEKRRDYKSVEQEVRDLEEKLRRNRGKHDELQRKLTANEEERDALNNDLRQKWKERDEKKRDLEYAQE